MPPLPPWALLALAIASEVVATSALKASEGFTRLGYGAVVVVGYGLAFWLMAQTLKHLAVGTVYAIWSGAGTAAIAVIGVVAFGEALTLPRALGIGLIVAGVIVLNIFGGGH